jgi:hypothetical protein
VSVLHNHTPFPPDNPCTALLATWCAWPVGVDSLLASPLSTPMFDAHVVQCRGPSWLWAFHVIQPLLASPLSTPMLGAITMLGATTMLGANTMLGAITMPNTCKHTTNPTFVRLPCTLLSCVPFHLPVCHFISLQPAFGAAQSSAGFGAFGGATSTPAFGAPASTPAFGAATTPAFGGFGASSTPAFGATTSTATPGGFGTPGSAAGSPFGTPGSATGFGAPASGGFGAAATPGQQVGGFEEGSLAVRTHPPNDLQCLSLVTLLQRWY